MQQKYVYEHQEQFNNWQDYDPNVIEDKNGYGNSSNNGHHYSQESVIYTEDEIIAEEYITTDGDLGIR